MPLKPAHQANMQALLISNSGRPYLEHAFPYLQQLLPKESTAHFISEAIFDGQKAYFERVRDTLAKLGIQVYHLNLNENPKSLLTKVECLLVGGGNTYRLLEQIQKAGIVETVRSRVLEGKMKYAGWSAGANVAGPTILTTNDWNVVGLGQFNSFHLVPFNINPHYKEIDPLMAPFSETRDDRIAEYHLVNSNSVVAIEEQTAVWVENGTCRVLGQAKVRVFRPKQKPQDYFNGAVLEGLTK